MLEEREEEIIELMAEVNKLQEKEQQSPEVVKTIQILKTASKDSKINKMLQMWKSSSSRQQNTPALLFLVRKSQRASTCQF